MASTGKIRIMGNAQGRPLTGGDLRVLLEDETGKQTLVPALSVTLRCAGHGEPVVAVVELPAVLVDVDGVQLQAEAKVDARGPESQWEASLGRQGNEPLADVPDVLEAAKPRARFHEGAPVVRKDGEQPREVGCVTEGRWNAPDKVWQVRVQWPSGIGPQRWLDEDVLDPPTPDEAKASLGL